MSNVLSEEQKQQVMALGRMGWSLRRIERDTGIYRDTAARYLREAGIAVNPGIPLDSPQRPAHPAQCQYLLFLLFAQDIAHESRR